MEREEGARVLDDKEVDTHNDDPNDEEHGVAEETIENVFLVVDLLRSNHVNDLEPDKQVENEGHVARIILINKLCVLNRLVELITIDLVKTTGEDALVIEVYFQANKWSQLLEAKLFDGLRDHVLTSEQEDEEDDHLEERHVQDVLGHLSRDYEVVSDLGWSLKKVGSWQFSGESKGSERVHDHVDPKELDGLQR